MEIGDDCARSWKALVELATAIQRDMPCIAADFGLSLPQCHALRCLEPGHPIAMGALAHSLGCDASNVTGIVDRLDSLGLIERRFAKSDRRVRMLTLTERGVEVRRDLLARIYEPPASIAALPREELESLVRTLEKLAVLTCRR